MGCPCRALCEGNSAGLSYVGPIDALNVIYERNRDNGSLHNVDAVAGAAIAQQFEHLNLATLHSHLVVLQNDRSPNQEKETMERLLALANVMVRSSTFKNYSEPQRKAMNAVNVAVIHHLHPAPVRLPKMQVLMKYDGSLV